jgi:translocation and assembly module TamB
VAATLARARIDQRASSTTTPGVPLELAISISAPNQVFIRGRGLDAEVGGTVQINGNVANIQPVGGLELIRGRLSILGQRIDFDEGTVTLIGDLDPFINLVARTEGSDITVIVTVSGRASSPEVTFSSDPMLPQDEVLARLIFDRGVGELSPLQLAQLAAAAAELAGGGSGSGSLLGSLRSRRARRSRHRHRFRRQCRRAGRRLYRRQHLSRCGSRGRGKPRHHRSRYHRAVARPRHHQHDRQFRHRAVL